MGNSESELEHTEEENVRETRKRPTGKSRANQNEPLIEEPEDRRGSPIEEPRKQRGPVIEDVTGPTRSETRNVDKESKVSKRPLPPNTRIFDERQANNNTQKVGPSSLSNHGPSEDDYQTNNEYTTSETRSWHYNSWRDSGQKPLEKGSNIREYRYRPSSHKLNSQKTVLTRPDKNNSLREKPAERPRRYVLVKKKMDDNFDNSIPRRYKTDEESKLTEQKTKTDKESKSDGQNIKTKPNIEKTKPAVETNNNSTDGSTNEIVGGIQMWMP
ncbi:unnamed protein product [Mytilus edulis]|uniref:Uncharacterized protein n=1 Tax=Mytilus edulis TaxID=6550 RepID=A0A8S3TAQ9_MYTED|nr:unnamed protein product [Mytilus edulis]